MPRLRRSVQKIDGLQTGPIDSEEQDELVDLLKLENYQTNWQFINILTVLYLFPIPLFIHLRYYRRLPVDSFLSIVVQIFSVVGVRYLSFFPTEGDFVLKQLTKHLVFDTFMNIIAVVVLWRQLDLSVLKSLLYSVPLVSSISSTLAQYWILQLNGSIEGLNTLKYKYKSA